MDKVNKADRDKIIVRTSVIGITANMLLALFKASVGLLSHSIAIVLDAVNNLSDALSSVITIIGTRLAGKAPDKKHPLGYGRIEFLSAALISMIVLYAGLTSFTESVKKILSPETPDYSAATLIIVAAAVAVKIVLGRYVKHVGQSVHSDALVNSGEDATLDSVISASTLLAAAIYIFTKVSLEAWLGAIISVVIIKSGVEMLRDAISQILGERVEGELSKEIKNTITETEGVGGAYDLILHNYGPDRWQGSVHVEVPDTMTAMELDQLTRRIQEEVYVRHHVILTAIGIYAVNTQDDKAMEARTQITRYVMGQEYVMQMHGFYLDFQEKRIRFDVVIDFAAPDREAVHCEIVKHVQEMYPDFTVLITMDSDISD